MAETYTKWLRWGILGGLGLSLFIPFIIANGSLFPDSFFPFITGKNFVFRILVELLFGMYLILALREPKYRPRFSWVLAAVALFTLWVGVATLTSVDPIKSFWSNFERMEGYITVLHLLMYFIVAGTMLMAERLWVRFMQGSVFASALMGVYGILQLTGHITINQGGVRLDGTLGNATYLAVYELFNIFFALFLLSYTWKHAYWRYVYGAVALLDTFILFYTQTRGTVLGLIGGLFIAGLYLLYATRRAPEWGRARRYTLGVVVGLIVVVLGFIAIRNTSFIQHSAAFQRLASISLQDKTTESRFMIWNMAWQGFKEKPVFGWGQENFSYIFNKYYDPAMYDQEQWFDRAHNAFLDWLTASGAPGFLLFVSLFALALAAIWRTRDLSVLEKATLIGLLFGYAIHEMFVFDNIVSYILFFSVLAFAHGLSQREVPATVWLARPLSPNGMAVVTPLIVVATVGGLWFANAGGLSNATGLLRAIEPPGSTAIAPADLSGNLAWFKKTTAGSQLGRQEAVEQLLQFAPQVAAAQSVDPGLKQQFYQTAHDAIDAMTKERSGDARLELFYGAFLDQYGQFDEARIHLAKALEASQKKQQILLEIAINNLIPSNDAKDAVSVLKTAFEFAPQYDTARVYYAAVLRLTGDNKTADQLLVERFGSATPDNATLLQVYFSTGQYAQAKSILSARLAKNPHDAQSWIQYAAVFYKAGDIAGAINALRQGAKEDPTFATQAQQLITQLQSEQQSGGK